MKFTDSRTFERKGYLISRRDVIFVIAGHVLILVVGLITSSSSIIVPPGGGDAIMVNMVTLTSNEMASSPPDIVHPDENPAEVPIEVSVPEVTEEQIIEEQETEDQIPDPVEEVPEEQPLDEAHEESEVRIPLKHQSSYLSAGKGQPAQELQVPEHTSQEFSMQ